jgi:UDP-N-acetylmuramoyl-tripeptide--D-alanyl-D-alanine ligase
MSKQNETLWTWQALAEIFPDQSSLSADIHGVSIDSRSVNAGDLFIALAGDPGPRFSTSSQSAGDGHEFVDKAIANGAAAVMLSAAYFEKAQPEYPVLVVEDTLDGLWQLGASARDRMTGTVVAITGSAGKTTARHWLEQLLIKQGSTHASTGSLNNHWGVPVSLARMPSSSRYGVFEVGTNHPGEIAPLSLLTKPHVSILLNVLPAHIGNFENLDAIRREKLTITDGLEPDGVLIVPEALNTLGTRASHIVTFGLQATADVHLIGSDKSTLVASVRGKEVSYTLNNAGEHRVLTSLAVLAAVDLMGADVAQAAADFSLLEAPSGRGNQVSIACEPNAKTASNILVIDDSYNANSVSMSYAIDALASTDGARTIALLGEMLELGDTSLTTHEQVAGHAAVLNDVITFGDGFSTCPGKSGHYGTVAEFDVDAFAKTLRAGDVLLVKGSNKVFWAHGFTKKLIEAIQKRFQ